MKSKQLDVGEAPVEIVGGYVVKMRGGGMRVFKWVAICEVRWGGDDVAWHSGVGRGPRSFRNSGRARACLGGVTKGLVSAGVKELPCDRFQAFKIGVRMMGRE